jgi:hypothetical protein
MLSVYTRPAPAHSEFDLLNKYMSKISFAKNDKMLTKTVVAHDQPIEGANKNNIHMSQQ